MKAVSYDALFLVGTIATKYLVAVTSRYRKRFGMLAAEHMDAATTIRRMNGRFWSGEYQMTANECSEVISAAKVILAMNSAVNDSPAPDADFKASVMWATPKATPKKGDYARVINEIRGGGNPQAAAQAI